MTAVKYSRSFHSCESDAQIGAVHLRGTRMLTVLGETVSFAAVEDATDEARLAGEDGCDGFSGEEA